MQKCNCIVKFVRRNYHFGVITLVWRNYQQILFGLITILSICYLVATSSYDEENHIAFNAVFFWVDLGRFSD